MPLNEYPSGSAFPGVIGRTADELDVSRTERSTGHRTSPLAPQKKNRIAASASPSASF